MKITDLPQFASLARRKDVKVIRHKDTKIDLLQLYHQGKFDDYQNGQSRDVFAKASYLISFLAERDKYAKFIGVYKVKGVRPKHNGFRYYTKKLDGFSDLEDRLVVYWGEGTRSWYQWLHSKGDKAINEILPPGYVKDFPGFYDFTLTYAELRQIASHPDANREWIRMLSAVAGVYAVQDTRAGMLYIGSAYGVDGLWGRWKAYANSVHGGNKELLELVDRDLDAANYLIFSILRALEPNARKDDVIAHEALLKKKLGTRVHGLNSN